MYLLLYCWHQEQVLIPIPSGGSPVQAVTGSWRCLGSLLTCACRTINILLPHCYLVRFIQCFPEFIDLTFSINPDIFYFSNTFCSVCVYIFPPQCAFWVKCSCGFVSDHQQICEVFGFSACSTVGHSFYCIFISSLVNGLCFCTVCWILLYMKYKVKSIILCI